MIIVVAPMPVVPMISIDQLIVAAKYLKIDKVSIVCNKTDMEGAEEMLARLERIYPSLGYPVISYSSIKKAKLSSFLKLRNIMMNKVSIFVGQSGVGKSSIINTLIPDAEAAEGELVTRTKLGSHTTSNATLYHLPFDKGDYTNEDNDIEDAHDNIATTSTLNDNNSVDKNRTSHTSATSSWLSSMSCLIDSPGVRELALWHVEPQSIKEGFIEINDIGKGCRFRNCMVSIIYM
jgi:ribosome biogenesis GTPase / thiamine phosphate phosphatase